MPASVPTSDPSRTFLTRFAWLSIAAAIVTIALKTSAWAMTGSVGLLSDAAESLVNLVAAGVALVALHISARPPDADHHFGHAKAEYFSAAIEATMIFAAAVIIVISAFERFLHPQPLDNVGIGLGVSAVASLVNGWVALVLLRTGKRHRSMTLTADGRHLLTDVWTSVGVIVGVLAVAVTGWVRLDPIVALAVGVNILVTGWHLLARSVDGLMDRALPDAMHAQIAAILAAHHEEGTGFHAVRTRESGYRTFVTAHLTVPGEWPVQRGHDLIDRVEAEIKAQLPNCDVLVHLEPAGQHCPDEHHAGQLRL